MQIVCDPYEHDLDRAHRISPVYDASALHSREAVLRFMRRYAVQPVVNGVDFYTLINGKRQLFPPDPYPPMLEHGVFFRFDHRPKTLACLVYEPKHWGDDELDRLRQATNEYLLPFMFETRPTEMWWPKNSKDMDEPLQISIWAGRQGITRAFNVWSVQYDPHDKY